tara:strand:- start:27 stop:236 length:210 start_codon:yes stop_codon:yes gene_type:complete
MSETKLIKFRAVGNTGINSQSRRGFIWKKGESPSNTFLVKMYEEFANGYLTKRFPRVGSEDIHMGIQLI